MASLSALHVFPVKSCAALAPPSALVEPRGLHGDRRWMVVDAGGRFLTARKHPRMTLVEARLAAGSALHLSAPDMPELVLEPAADAAERLEVTVWSSTLSARPASAAADAWISRWLGLPARFVYMDDATRRDVDPAYAEPGDIVSFADGFPILLISQAALDALNAKLATPVPMLRFRPNFVIAGTSAHAEDQWRRVRIGEVEFDVVKPCIRCVLTTVDFTRGSFDAGGEPLRTLMAYRRTPKGVSFGQNLIPRGTGTVRVGDEVVVLDATDA